MSTNIQDAEGLRSSGLKKGGRVHLGVCGNHVTDSAVYLGELWEEVVSDPHLVEVEVGQEKFQAAVAGHGPMFLAARLYLQRGIRVMIEGKAIELAWGDIIELWPARSLKEIEAERSAKSGRSS